MGDPSDFYNTRGANKLTYLEIEYASGRKEKLEFKSVRSMKRAYDDLIALPTVRKVKIA